MEENTREITAQKESKHLFKNLKAEFKKIIWPGKKEAAKKTLAVVIASLCLGVLIAVLDTVIKFGLGFIL